jgi:hypothetical protein
MHLLTVHTAAATAATAAAAAAAVDSSAPTPLVPMLFLNASPSLMQTALGTFPGALVAFSGAVTFSKSRQLHEAAFDCPMDRIALASEAPEHVPSQLAGRGGGGNHGHGGGHGGGGGRALEWSHPGTLAFAAQRIAEIKGRGCTADDVVAASARNVTRMLGGAERKREEEKARAEKAKAKAKEREEGEARYAPRQAAAAKAAEQAAAAEAAAAAGAVGGAASWKLLEAVERKILGTLPTGGHSLLILDFSSVDKVHQDYPF